MIRQIVWQTRFSFYKNHLCGELDDFDTDRYSRKPSICTNIIHSKKLHQLPSIKLVTSLYNEHPQYPDRNQFRSVQVPKFVLTRIDPETPTSANPLISVYDYVIMFS